MELFDQAFQIVIGHEGRFSNDPEDPGNWTGGAKGKGELRGTKYGISAASYPGYDIYQLTLDDAKALYNRDYWKPLRIFDLPDPIAILMFDMAVNMGKVRAVELVQRALGVKTDGILGPATRAAIKAMDKGPLVREITVQRIMYYTSLETFKTFGLGWVRRAVALTAFAAL